MARRRQKSPTSYCEAPEHPRDCHRFQPPRDCHNLTSSPSQRRRPRRRSRTGRLQQQQNRKALRQTVAAASMRGWTAVLLWLGSYLMTGSAQSLSLFEAGTNTQCVNLEQQECPSGQGAQWFYRFATAESGNDMLHAVGLLHLEAPPPQDHSVRLQARTFNLSGAPLCPMWPTGGAASLHKYFFKVHGELQAESSIHQLLYRRWQEPLPSSAPAWIRQSQTRGPTSLPHCITASLHHCITASLHHYITAPLHHYIAAPLHHCIAASLPLTLHHCTTAALPTDIASLHHCTIA